MIQKVGQIGVPVKNIETAVTFYQEKLELPLLFNTDRLAFFGCNGLRLMLSLPEKEEFSTSSSVIYFQVENLKEKYENLVEKGVTFIDEPHIVGKMGSTEIWMAFFKDTEDNTHALMSEVEA
ncbi:VOC family protein [Neobacillus sp. D3-1R]|uniref:VOC family protein n=1 Tax=Neobacillus sp. D3-1R TaxID=3445778 RepID=UPI003FA089B6